MRKKFLLALTGVIVICLGILIKIFAPPTFSYLKDFTHLKFPVGTKLATSSDNGEYIAATIELPKHEIDHFLEMNSLPSQTAKDKFSLSKCQAKQMLRFEINRQSGELYLQVFYPDPAGKSPCE